MMTAEVDNQLRAAAENLLSGSLQSQRNSVTQRSISSINREYIYSDDFLVGVRISGMMSSIRRFFCLLVTFDLLFTCLMWLICTAIAGENITDAFIEQVKHYRIQTSLFDIVMAAVCRFTILLLFYALLYVDHWIFVALTTASTCAFIGAKTYLYNWDSVQQPVFQALLIMTSFMICWIEAWYFDCRVIPQEMLAENWINTLPITDSVANERTSLLRNPHGGAPSRMTENLGNFFTPMDSPTHSDDEDVLPKFRKINTTTDNFLHVLQSLPRLSNSKIDECKERTKLLVNQSYELLTSNKWEELPTTANGDILSMLSSDNGKIWKIEGIINAPAHELVDQMYDNIEDMSAWNKDVSFVKRIETINENTDIFYQSTKTFAGGLIGPRDFITLRHRSKCGKYYMTSGTSMHMDIPRREHHTRGENGIICFATEQINDENKCRVTWILHTNLHGWLPQRLIDKTLASILQEMMNRYRHHICKLNDTSG